MTELCARYGISRKTGYKCIARDTHADVAGLAEQSRAPHRCPHRIAPAVAAAIVEARRQHPSWGPRKLLVWLADRRPGLELFLSQALKQDYIGLEETADGVWSIYFYDVLLGKLHERGFRIYA